jgi:hypothetical protein
MKTVINVYTKYIKLENYDSDIELTPGLGDFIRGTITLLILSKELQYNVLVDLRYTPISKFLKNQNIDKVYLNEVDKNLNNLKSFFFIDNLKNYLIELLKTDDIITLHTGTFIPPDYKINDKYIYYELLSQDDKNYIKNIMTPNDEFNLYIKEKMTNIPKNYEIIHFRLGDYYSFKSNIMPKNMLIKFEELFKNNYNINSVLITDNKYFKKYIKSKYNVHIIDNEIEHIGILNDDINNIINKKYTWGNSESKIKFLDNLNMDAFGIGNYKIIDNYNITAYFGNREHNIKFNKNYTEFTSIREGDLCIVKGNIFIEDNYVINDKLEGIKGSLFDFIIQSNSKKIITFTIYDWISNFIYFNTIIYNIKLENYCIKYDFNNNLLIE